MTVTQIPTPQAALEQAVTQVRRSRHHQDRRCGMFRAGGSPFCSSGEASWSSILDRLIEQARNSPNSPKVKM